MWIKLTLVDNQINYVDSFGQNDSFNAELSWRDPQNSSTGFNLMRRGNDILFFTIEDVELVHTQLLVENEESTVNF